MKDYKTTWQVHGIFPEPIYLSHLNRSFTKKELKSVESHKKGLIQNAGNKTSKNKYVLNKPEMSKLKKDLLKHVNLYLEKVIATEHKVTLNITQSWLNYTNENQYHHEHSHSNSFLSGVLYMKANSETDRIFFHKDMSKGTLRLKPKTFNLYNSPEWFFRVAESMLVLFPSYLVHSVKTKDDDGERISLAFNVYLKGKIGSYHSITELVL
jgi:uncharacterized protein (TIGR02466 family)|tara:strand:+ start:1886 stop:2515 length:630 start_codon:yes stop_codon:yes gene_type:complete